VSFLLSARRQNSWRVRRDSIRNGHAMMIAAETVREGPGVGNLSRNGVRSLDRRHRAPFSPNFATISHLGVKTKRYPAEKSPQIKTAASGRVFQHPQDFATSIRIDVSGPVNLQSFVSDSPSYQELNNSSATRVGFRIASSTIDLLHRAPIMIEPGEAFLVPKRERQAVTGI
jgi:hypothetical protein